MVLKKDLTPLSKRGRVVKHAGKGSAAGPPHGDPLARSLGRYPAMPQPQNDQSQMPAPSLGGPMLGASPPPAGGTPPGVDIPPATPVRAPGIV